MRTAPAGVVSFVNANNVAFRADLYTLTLLSGTVYRWTTADFDVSISANTWSANGAVLRRGNIRQTSRLEIDSLEIELSGATVVAGKTLAVQAAQGFFDGARLQLDHLVGSDAAAAIAAGPILSWYEGRIAGIDPKPTVVKLHVESELAALNQLLPRYLYQAPCGNAVYDPNCTLVKGTYALSGAASGVPTTTTVPTTTAALTAKASGYFALGVVTFTGGANTGLRRAVKSWDGTTLTLALPLPQAPAAGDTFTVYPGCDRTKTTCNSRFGNLVNFRGFAHIPTPEGGM